MYSGATTAPSSPSLSSLAPGRPPTQPLRMHNNLVPIRPGGTLRRRVSSRPASAVGGSVMSQYHERRPDRGGLSTGGYTSGDTPSSPYTAPVPSTDDASRLFRLQFPHLAIPNPYNTSGIARSDCQTSIATPHLPAHGANCPPPPIQHPAVPPPGAMPIPPHLDLTTAHVGDNPTATQQMISMQGLTAFTGQETDFVCDARGTIGRGSYGAVSVVRVSAHTSSSSRLPPAGTRAAVKKVLLRTPNTPPGGQMKALDEVKMLARAQGHENIVGLLSTFQPSNDANGLCIVMELCMFDMTALSHVAQLTDRQTRCLMYQAVDGLASIHDRNMIHRDIKGGNLLVTSNFRVKIADFGMACLQGSYERLSPGGPPRMSTGVQTDWHRAPEVLALAHWYGPAVDMWSLGAVFVHITKRVYPFRCKVSEIKCDSTPKPQSVPDLMLPPNAPQMQPRDSYASFREQLKAIYQVAGPYTAVERQQEGIPLHTAMVAVDNQPNAAAMSRMNRLVYFKSLGFARDEEQSLLLDLFEVDPSKRVTARNAMQHPYFTAASPDEPGPWTPLSLEETQLHMRPGYELLDMSKGLYVTGLARYMELKGEVAKGGARAKLTRETLNAHYRNVQNQKARGVRVPRDERDRLRQVASDTIRDLRKLELQLEAKQQELQQRYHKAAPAQQPLCMQQCSAAAQPIQPRPTNQQATSAQLQHARPAMTHQQQQRCPPVAHHVPTPDALQSQSMALQQQQQQYFAALMQQQQLQQQQLQLQLQVQLQLQQTLVQDYDLLQRLLGAVAQGHTHMGGMPLPMQEDLLLQLAFVHQQLAATSTQPPPCVQFPQAPPQQAAMPQYQLTLQLAPFPLHAAVQQPSQPQQQSRPMEAQDRPERRQGVGMRADATIFRPASMQPPPEPSNAQVEQQVLPSATIAQQQQQQQQQQVATAAVHGAWSLPVHQHEPTQVTADQLPVEDLGLLAGLLNDDDMQLLRDVLAASNEPMPLLPTDQRDEAAKVTADPAPVEDLGLLPGLLGEDMELLQELFQDSLAASDVPVPLLPTDQRGEAAKVMTPAAQIAAQMGDDAEPVEVTSKKIRMLPLLGSSIEQKVEVEQGGTSTGYVSTPPAKRTRLQSTEATEAEAAAATLPQDKGLWTAAGYLQHNDKHVAANASLPSDVPPTPDAQMRGRKRSASPSPSNFNASEVLTQPAAKRLAATNAHNAPSVVLLVAPASVCSTKACYVPPPVNERKRKSRNSDGEEEAVVRGA